jgi:hypothetical protein
MRQLKHLDTKKLEDLLTRKGLRFGRPKKKKAPKDTVCSSTHFWEVEHAYPLKSSWRRQIGTLYIRRGFDTPEDEQVSVSFSEYFKTARGTTIPPCSVHFTYIGEEYGREDFNVDGNPVDMSKYIPFKTLQR